jgi:hypothetical protein
MQITAHFLLNISIGGMACLVIPKAIANPTTTTLLTSDPTLAVCQGREWQIFGDNFYHQRGG